MLSEPAETRFPESIVFPDVDVQCLVEEEANDRSVLLDPGAWKAYLRKLLPPVAETAARSTKFV